MTTAKFKFVFWQKRKENWQIYVRPSLHFYGMLFWWKKGLCRGMAWMAVEHMFLEKVGQQLNLDPKMLHENLGKLCKKQGKGDFD